MPRKKKLVPENKQRGTYGSDAIRHALFLNKENGFSMKQAASTTGVPLRTLWRWFAKSEDGEEIPDRPANLICRRVFSDEQERQLAAYIKQCGILLYGLDVIEARRLAANFAERLGPQANMPEEWKAAQMAGKDWLRAFLNRQKLSLRMPEATSMARATGFNRAAVEAFFKNLTDVYEKFQFEPSRIWNFDETGVSNVQKPHRVIAETGRKQVGQISSAERGVLVTVGGAVNATGNAMPPVLLYPRVRIDPKILGRGAPAGSLILGNKSGWMTAEEFPSFLQHFQKHTHSTKENPTLLLLDNHASHSSIEAVQYCRDNGITMLTFPPHTSHRLQVLDITVYGPFKAAYNKMLQRWMVANPGKRSTLYDYAGFVNEAFDASFSRKNIIGGFSKSGIWPYNPEIFDEADFIASTVYHPLVTDEAAHGTTTPTEEAAHGTTTQTDEAAGTPIPTEEAAHGTTTPTDEAAGSTTPTMDEYERPSTPTVTQNPHKEKDVTPSTIRPLPRLTVLERKKGRKRGSSKVLTSTPEKDRLLDLLNSRNNKKKRKTAASEIQDILERVSTPKKAGSSGACVRKLMDDDSESDLDEPLLDSDTPSDYPSEPEDESAAPQEGDFVAVRVVDATGKLSRNFVGEVKVVNDQSISLIFLKKGKKAFIYPEQEDSAIVSNDDIIAKLPAPTRGLTNRTKGMIHFPVNLHSYGL